MDLNVLNMPEQFVCPITTKLLIEPVLSVSCGHHFERAAVEGRVNLVCPIDGIPLSQHLYPAREFQEVIKHWVTLDQWARCMETQLKRLLKKENDNTNLEPIGTVPHAPLAYAPTQSHPNHNSNPSLLNINTDTSEHSAAFVSRNVPQSIDRKTSNIIPTPVSNIVVPAPIPQSASVVSITDSGEKVPVDPRKYKTRLCRSWLQFGTCPYSEMCCFAHGDTELRDAATNLKVLDALRYVDFENVDQNTAVNTPPPEPSKQKQGKNKAKSITPNTNSAPVVPVVPKSQSEPKLSNETLRHFLSGQSPGSPFLYFAPGPNPIPSDNHMEFIPKSFTQFNGTKGSSII